MQEQDQGEKGKPVELRIYSPPEAIEEIYDRLAVSRSEWDPFDKIRWTINIGDHSASLDFNGWARTNAYETEILALGRADDPRQIIYRGDTLIAAKIGESFPTTNQEEFLKRVISPVASGYYPHEPGLLMGPRFPLGGLDFVHGSFGKDREIRGVLVSVINWRLRILDPTQKVGNSIEITQALIDSLKEQVEAIMASTRF